MTKVRDVMTADPVIITGDTSLAEASRIMRERDIGVLIVLEQEDFAGVVTDRDIVVRGVAEHRLPDETPVSDVASKEIVTIRATAPAQPDAATRDGMPWMTAAEAQPARADARTYFHTTAITGAIPKWIGLPAYQNAGIVRIQKDVVQAMAIPTGPHGSARTNNRAVTVASMSPQRNQRSALPIERWIQPWVE